ncbi:hypothetical protein [Chryseobacterium sp. BIGb0232]|uniref:hypothetical protein n=1 Tax=Chryseobacterium sp. BIGb0232 TaxID=2940598 RepID=UPI000F461ABC|nr:hypothetical protein [Chryseobacterium sp. BIGb0232]MCS4303045.1 hypothetical protein [Chryseobacterium sp. BIGb0232]ROS14663.1 hypothetical protein EDF65_3442 [Chryseobacterium nakagawai]
MKKILLFSNLLASIVAFGQVGVNTKDPKAMLDIKGMNYDPDGTSNDNGKATLRVDGSSNHSLDIGTLSKSPFGSYIQSLDKSSNKGLPLVLNSNGGSIGIGTTSPRGALDINKGTTNTMGLVLPTNQNSSNIINPQGGSVAIGTIIYDTTSDCIKVFKSTGWSQCLCTTP